MKTYRIPISKTSNAKQMEFFDDDKSKLLHLSGGFGCIDESSVIETANGPKAAGDIYGMQHYKSFDGNQFIWSLGTAPYPKGRAILYRVIHERGEFLATGFHRVFCADYRYRYVAELCVQQGLYSSDQNLHGSSSGACQTKSCEDAPHCFEIASTRILAIEKVKTDWFWDLHVFGTNNYCTGNTVHHNSGKSYMLAMKLLKLSMLNRNIRGGAVMPDFQEYRRDFRPALVEILDTHNIPFKEHKSHNTWRFPWSNKEIQVVSAEKRIRGPNWGFCVINELTLMPYVRYQEAIGRVRVKGAPCPQIASSGTPEGFASEYYEPLIEKPKPGTRVISVSTRENVQNLGDDYVRTLESSYDSTQQQAYLDGEWINMTANRFYYKYDPARHDDAEIEFSANEIFPQTVIVTMDFNVNPMTASMWQQREIIPGIGLRRIVAFDEIELTGDADTDRMAKALIDSNYTPDRVVIYADPAGRARSTKGAPDTKILKDYGFEVRTKTSAPRFRQRMLNAGNLFDKGIIGINPIKCPNLKRDLQNVAFNPATFEKLKDNPKLTHFSDGMDYGLDILYPFQGNRDSISTVKVR